MWREVTYSKYKGLELSKLRKSQENMKPLPVENMTLITSLALLCSPHTDKKKHQVKPMKTVFVFSVLVPVL